MNQPPQEVRHPKGLYMLFTTEMWERFNFYGMRALLTLFLVNAMLFSESEASLIYGAYAGLSYLTPMLGGYMADNVWGNRKSIVVGGSLMAAGQLLLFFSGSIYASHLGVAITVLWIALGLVILGNGFFKPNISSMVGQLYRKGDSRLDSAYTIFYMGINMGAFIGMSICPLLGDVHDSTGARVVSAFRWGFLAAGIAMILGTVLFALLRKKYCKDPEGNPVGVPPKAAKDSKSTAGNAKGAFSKRSLVCFAIGFAILLTIFYILSDGGIINLIYSIIYAAGLALAGLIMYGDNSLQKEEKDKILVLYIVSFFVIFFWACFEQAGSSLTFIADYQTDRNVFGFDVPPSAVQNANSLSIMIFAFPIAFLWRWMEMRNIKWISSVKQSLGLLLLAIGYLIIAWQVRDLGISGKIGIVWLLLMYLFHTLGELCLSPIGLSLVSKLAPIRFISLLMGVWFLANASGYALAGTLGSLLPPTGDKYIKAEKLDIDLEAVLEKRISLSGGQIMQLQNQDIPITYPKFMGVEISNLFDFFMLFVILAGVAGFLLLLLTPFLKRRMHGVT